MSDHNYTPRLFFLSLFSLFSSTTTLLCCALPILLVTVGLGATLAGFVSANPWLSLFGEYKILFFSFSAILLALATFVTWRGRDAPCPTDAKAARLCTLFRKINLITLAIAYIIFITGFFFAFLAVYFIR